MKSGGEMQSSTITLCDNCHASLSVSRRYNEDVLERLRGLSVDPLPDIDKEVLKNERAERDLQEQVFSSIIMLLIVLQVPTGRSTSGMVLRNRSLRVRE